ncbi:MAG: hypothetical protein JNK10_03875 [Cyclobacteriaceae bacterium]|nr:hypothetical protein [Cyclobacteriaceae bacterium]
MKALSNNFLSRFIKCVISDRKEMPCSLRNELFISGLTRTHLFRRQAIQDQIISLAKLINLFERDFGYKPERPVQVLTTLNERLNMEIDGGVKKR